MKGTRTTGAAAHVRDRVQTGNRLRSHLREYFPGCLTVFKYFREGLASPVTRTQLARPHLRAILKKAGRQREITGEVEP